MTYRERREARAQRLREWAEKREHKAESAYKSARAIMDHIPMGQPILVGHHSEKHARRDVARIDSKMRQSFEHGQKSREMSNKAAEIERQAQQAIYSDDPDAQEALTAKIERLEAERDRITAYNASCRKAAKLGKVGDTSLLDESQQNDLRTLARVAAYQLRPGGAFPPYVASNLGGNIKRLRDRLALLDGPKPYAGHAHRLHDGSGESVVLPCDLPQQCDKAGRPELIPFAPIEARSEGSA